MVDALVMEPVKMHVHGFGELRLYRTVDDTLSSTVVSLYRRRRLTVDDVPILARCCGFSLLAVH